MKRTDPLLSLPVLLLVAACSGPPCKSQPDCELGSYCAITFEEGQIGELQGECVKDCVTAADCDVGNGNLLIAVCSNEGRCEAHPRPPRLTLFEPEPDKVFPEGTRAIRISGEVESAADTVQISARASGEGSCVGSQAATVTVVNPTPGEFATVPFVLEGFEVDPGSSGITVTARVGLVEKSESLGFTVECAGCAHVGILEPDNGAAARGLELNALSGTVDPAAVRTVVWRVHSSEGDIIDGVMALNDGRFQVKRVPLFAGLNRVEVVVSGVGSGLGESRCSRVVSSSEASESGLRVILSWDGGSSDLDLHLVGPNGRLGDAATELSLRSPHPFFSGEVQDDPAGYGPETIRVQAPPDGVYGLVVEPIIDGADRGSDAFVRVLFDGRTLIAGPVGPRHLTALDGKLWVVGKIAVSGGVAEWSEVDELVDGIMPPTRAPAEWPSFY